MGNVDDGHGPIDRKKCLEIEPGHVNRRFVAPPIFLLLAAHRYASTVEAIAKMRNQPHTTNSRCTCADFDVPNKSPGWMTRAATNAK